MSGYNTLDYTGIHSTKTHYITIDFPKLKLPTPQYTSILFLTPRSLHLTTLQYFCCYFCLFLALAKPVIQVTSREQYNTLLTYTTLYYTLLYCNTLYYTLLYDTTLYCTTSHHCFGSHSLMAAELDW